MKDPVFIDNLGAIDYYAGAVRMELVTYEDIAYAAGKTPRTATRGTLITSLDGFQAMLVQLNSFAEQLRQHGLLPSSDTTTTTPSAVSPNFPDEEST